MFRSPTTGTVDRLFGEARLLREVEATAIKKLVEAGSSEGAVRDR